MLQNLFIALPTQNTLKIIQPMRLIVVFGRQNSGVQENQYYDQPVENLRLDGFSTGPSHSPVHSANFHCKLVRSKPTINERGSFCRDA